MESSESGHQQVSDNPTNPVAEAAAVVVAEAEQQETAPENANCYGLQYNFACGEDEGVPVLVPPGIEGIEGGIFSYEDLYSVLEASNPESITEINGNIGDAWQGPTFIPLGSAELKPCHGEGDNPNATGLPGASFIRLILNAADAPNSSAAAAVGISTDGFKDAGNVGVETNKQIQEGSQQGQKQQMFAAAAPQAGSVLSPGLGKEIMVPIKTIPARKPRGRKPKTVKDALAAAAAARNPELSKNEAASSPQQRVTTTDRGQSPTPTPSVTLHHHAGAVVSELNMHASSSIDYSNQSTSGLAAYQQGAGKITVGQMDCQGANIPYGRKFNIGGEYSGSLGMPIKCHYGNIPGNFDEGMTASQGCDQIPCTLRGYSLVDPQQGYGSIPANAVNHGSLFVESNDPRSEQQTGRLEQFFSNRISNIATPKKSTVTPSYIKRNMALYNQLTAPKKHSNSESVKLAQEKWMQFPNPMGNEKGGQMENQLHFGPAPMQKSADPSTSTLNFSPGNGSNMQYPYCGAEPTMQNMQQGFPPNMSMRNVLRNNHCGPGGCGGEQGMYNGPIRQPEHAHHRNGSGSSRSSLYVMYSQIQDLYSKLETLTIENRELKVKVHYQNKHLHQWISRQHQIFEDVEGMKSFLQMNLGPRAPFQDKFYSDLPASSSIMNRGYRNESRSFYGVGKEPTAPGWRTVKIKEEPQDLNNFMEEDGLDGFTPEFMFGKTLKRETEPPSFDAIKRLRSSNAEILNNEDKINDLEKFGAKGNHPDMGPNLLIKKVAGAAAKVDDQSRLGKKAESESSLSPEKSVSSGSIALTEVVGTDEDNNTQSTVFDSPQGGVGGTAEKSKNLNFNAAAGAGIRRLIDL